MFCRKRKASLFLSHLRASFSGHPTLETVWSWLLGESVPPPRQRQILVDHLNSLGWEVSPRDFVRGTAASNHPQFILLRMLSRRLSRSELDNLFFGNSRLK